MLVFTFARISADYQSLMRPVLECAARGEVRIGDVVDAIAALVGTAQLAFAQEIIRTTPTNPNKRIIPPITPATIPTYFW